MVFKQYGEDGVERQTCGVGTYLFEHSLRRTLFHGEDCGRHFRHRFYAEPIGCVAVVERRAVGQHYAQPEQSGVYVCEIRYLLENHSPSTPLVNAGAISACSMIEPKGDSDAKWKAITDNITDLCGSAPVLIDELYKSESDTNFNNRAITWLLKNYERVYDDPQMSLDLYTRQCSLGITCEQLAVMAATIAAHGVNPLTRKQVFDKSIAPKITSLIATVGFYQSTGNWLYTSGIPAKSGVGGGVLGVLPGVFGIAAFAPPLDEAGNSVKAQAAVKKFMSLLGLGIMNGDFVTITD